MQQLCPLCGHPARPGARFCSVCGRPITQVAYGSGQALQLSQTRDVVRIMSTREILANSVRLFFRSFLRLFLASLVGYAIWALMTIVLLTVLVAPILLMSNDNSEIALLLATLLISLPIAVINAPLTLAVSSIVLADRISYSNLIGSVLGRRLVFLLITVALQSLLVLLGSILFLIPGIYLAVVFSMSPATVMLEDRAGWGALQRSRDLVRGYWWKSFGLMLVSLLIPVITLLTVVAVVVMVVGEFSIGGSIVTGIFLLATVAVPCFAAVVQTLLYYDLRSRRGNFSAKSLLTLPTLQPIFERI